MSGADDSSAARLVFMGSSSFAIPSLEALAACYSIVGVYTQPPRPKGRGLHERRSPVHEKAIEPHLNLDVYTPSAMDADAVAGLKALRPDLLVVVAYGLILPRAVLDIPRCGALNGHASLLPRWRGAAPVQRAIAAGDTETGVSLMMMVEALDEGPVIAHRSIAIEPDDNAGSLHDKLAVLTADMLRETIPLVLNNRTEPVPQDETAACYAQKITDAETELNLDTPTRDLLDRIRAFAPWPGAWLIATHDNAPPRRLVVLEAAPADTPAGASGKSGQCLGQGAKGGIVFATANGAIELIRIKPAGKQSMTARDYLNGNPMPLAAQPAAQRE